MNARRGDSAVRRRVLITGAGRGIGLELTRQYAAEGYDVIATCRDPERATELRALTDDAESTVVIERLDVASEDDLDAVVTRMGDTPIDILICNAAVFGGSRSRFADVDWAAWRVALEINLLGSMRVALGLWRNVAASEERKIVSRAAPGCRARRDRRRPTSTGRARPR